MPLRATEAMNKNQRGGVSELAAQYDLARQGWQVFPNATPAGNPDLLIYDPITHESYRVEVKSLNKRGHATFPEKQVGHTDLLAVVSRDGRVFYTDKLYSTHVSEVSDEPA